MELLLFFKATSFMSSLIQQQLSENKKTFIAFQYHKRCSSIQSTAHKTERKQDKVNYAVSEREDRVTDVTTLMRMTGCTGLQLGCTEL